MIDFAATGLPAAAVLDDLKTALDARPNAVLVAPPGAGKTTLVPLALLDSSWAKDRKIIMLEPRRLAARAAARRMAALLGGAVGEIVGYRMRLDSKVSAATRIEVVTEGVFARMILDDPELTGIAAVIFDEFHERSLDADFSLVLALDVQSALREDLRLIIMSATLDGGQVATLLDAPIIESSGRSYPVELRHQPRRPDQRIEDAVADAVRAALRDETGSILAFLPGQAEIRRTAERLEPHLPANTFLAPLYGAMDIRDQDRAIAPADASKRKIVLATAIAESSVTIDGVRVVIDSGLSRQPVFEPGQAITRLETVRVSRASADQRAGRAGRTQAGVAIRLWHEGQTASLVPFDPPEIARTDLSRMLLDCLAWGVADPRSLRFLDPPPEPALNEARKRLLALGAIDERGSLTAKGERLRAISLPVPLAAMLAEAKSAADAEQRARLAVLITERGLGGSTSDLERRMQAFQTDRSPRAKQSRQLAARLAQSASPSNDSGGGPSSIGVMLLDAFPDRVAKARSGQPGRFVMAGGRGVVADETDPLAAHTYIVVADVTGVAAGPRLLAGAPITQGEIEIHRVTDIETQNAMTFQPETGQLSARRIRKLGAITLSSAPRPAKAGTDATHALLDAVRRHGLAILPWDKASQNLRARLGWLHARSGAPWPDVSDEALIATLETWLEPFLVGQTNLRTVPLTDALMVLAGHGAQYDLDRLAPSHFTAPTGSRIALSYPADGAAPELAIRVQELFGLSTHPMVMDGAVPLVIELLSPAHRPIQRTTDLPAFWVGSWRDVRADMRGRYPKHSWPENPQSALPTRRAKPR